MLWLRWRQEQWACRQQEMWVCNDCVFVLEKKVKQMHTQRSSGCTPRINKEVAACLPALQRESGLCTSVRVTNTVAAWISSSNTENLFMRWQISIVVESGNFRHNVYKMFKYRVIIIISTISQLQHWKEKILLNKYFWSNFQCNYLSTLQIRLNQLTSYFSATYKSLF